MKVPLTKLIQLFASADSDSYHHSQGTALQPEKLPKKCSTTFWFPIFNSFQKSSKHLSQSARKLEIHASQTNATLSLCIHISSAAGINGPLDRSITRTQNVGQLSTHTLHFPTQGTKLVLSDSPATLNVEHIPNM